MESKSDRWIFDFASVTSEGLKFNGRIYTNPSMIKYRWFELAHIQGSWQIPILYSESKNETIILFDTNSSYDIAVCVETNKLSSEELKKYFNKFNQLREERNNNQY